MALGAALFRVMSRRSNRLVYTIHTLQEDHSGPDRRTLERFRHDAKRAARSFAHSLILMAADRVVVLTQSMVNQMSPVEQWAARGKTEIIPIRDAARPPPRTTDIETFRRQFGLEDRWPVLCTVGVFFHDWKVRGQELLIEAVARLRPDFPKIMLVIVGDGQHRGRLERRISEKGLDGYVRITGYLPNAYAALACTDVYTHMALREAQGVAIVEAMLAGKPIVAANRGGIPEVTPDGDSALLVEPNAEAVDHAVRRLLTDPALATRLAENAKERATSRFSPEATNNAYLALYHELRLRPQGSE
jgi:glycosyltransferase involved in cell wall biosynthesis